MVSRVLVPMDDSEMAARALEYALEVHDDAAITVLHVVGEPSGLMGEATAIALDDDPQSAAEEIAADVFERASEIAVEHDAEIGTEIGLGKPARVIVDHAADYDAVVVGSHGGSLAARLFTGDVAQAVFRNSPVPVTVVR